MKLTNRSLPLLFGLIAAVLHSLFVAYIFLVAEQSEGSWTGFVGFVVDFPFSIIYLAFDRFVPFWVLPMTLGSAWWAFLTWLFMKLVLTFVNRKSKVPDSN